MRQFRSLHFKSLLVQFSCERPHPPHGLLSMAVLKPKQSLLVSLSNSSWYGIEALKPFAIQMGSDQSEWLGNSAHDMIEGRSH